MKVTNISFINKTITCLAILQFIGSQAVAATYCTTTINQVLIYDTGDVWINGTASGGTPYSGYQRLCNLNGTAGTASVTTCVAWLSLAKQAQGVTNIITQTYYGSLNACSEIPNSFPFSVFFSNSK